MAAFPAEAETDWSENEWNYLDMSMDVSNGIPEDAELAELAGTIPYELLCGISLRVPRLYVD